MANTKTAMIWGADGGIGKALLSQLSAENWTIAAISRHPDALSDLTPFSFEADISNEMAIKSAILETNYEVGEIDLWIYAVGDIISATTKDMAYTEWQRIINANLTGAYLTAHHSMPLLKENAHLFYLGAVSERLRLPKLSAYAAAKAGLEAYAEALRKEERKKRVTVVRPGGMWQPLFGTRYHYECQLMRLVQKRLLNALCKLMMKGIQAT